MRVSTNMIYDRGVGTIQQLWSNLLHVQQEVATGRRILTPADDPIAASRALDVNKSRVINAQYKVNLDTATDNLRLVENKLMGMGEILQYMRERAIGAGNGILTQQELDFFVIDLRNQFDALVALANTQDAAGNYLFSGYKADVQPFQGGYGSITYEGDQGTRTIQVSSSRFMPVSLPGSELFEYVFDNLATFIDALENPGPGGVIDGMKFGLNSIDHALDIELRVRAQIGSQLVELEQLDNVNADMDIQYADTLNRLEGCDYAEAISRLTRLQTNLEASQLSFMRVSGLSLFNYLQ
jgi:flagellar hook-associated protein 3 FlgL